MITDDEVGRIVQAFAGAVLDPTEWMPALLRMSEAMGSASSSLELADLNTGFASINCTSPLDDDIIDLYEERVYHINPRVQRARQIPVGAMVDDRTLLVESDPNMGEFMDWLRKTPNRFVLGTKLFQSGGHEIYFGSYFSEKQGPPQSWHENVHRLVIPHLVNFVAAGKALSANRLNNELVTINHLEGEHPFALLDRAGRIVECSAGFEAMLKSSSILGSSNRRLAAIHAQHRRQVELFLELLLGNRRLLELPMPIRLATTDLPRGLIVRGIPLEPSDDVFGVFRPAALVTITDLDRPHRVRRKELVELFTLTLREADVAALISEGYAPEKVAHRLGISAYTVRQHLKAVFGKMGVSRQSELVSIISRIA